MPSSVVISHNPTASTEEVEYQLAKIQHKIESEYGVLVKLRREAYDQMRVEQNPQRYFGGLDMGY